MKRTHEAFVKHRDEVLLSGDVVRVMIMLRQITGHHPTRGAAEIAMHEAITATVSLPMEHRAKSKKWLLERGFKSLDAGDVPY